MVIGPLYSERRSCSAVRAAASPPPTMTMPPLVVTWCSYTMAPAGMFATLRFAARQARARSMMFDSTTMLSLRSMSALERIRSSASSR